MLVQTNNLEDCLEILHSHLDSVSRYSRHFVVGFIQNPKVYLYFRKVNRTCQDNYNHYIMYKKYLSYNAMYDKIYCTS